MYYTVTCAKQIVCFLCLMTPGSPDLILELGEERHGSLDTPEQAAVAERFKVSYNYRTDTLYSQMHVELDNSLYMMTLS